MYSNYIFILSMGFYTFFFVLWISKWWRYNKYNIEWVYVNVDVKIYIYIRLLFINLWLYIGFSYLWLYIWCTLVFIWFDWVYYQIATWKEHKENSDFKKRYKGKFIIIDDQEIEEWIYFFYLPSIYLIINFNQFMYITWRHS